MKYEMVDDKSNGEAVKMVTPSQIYELDQPIEFQQAEGIILGELKSAKVYQRDNARRALHKAIHELVGIQIDRNRTASFEPPIYTILHCLTMRLREALGSDNLNNFLNPPNTEITPEKREAVSALGIVIGKLCALWSLPPAATDTYDDPAPRDGKLVEIESGHSRQVVNRLDVGADKSQMRHSPGGIE